MASAKSPVMDRETMESGTGLLMWAAEYRRELRPWLAAFYHALSAPVATLCSVSAAGWSEIVEHFSESMLIGVRRQVRWGQGWLAYFGVGINDF